MQIGHDPASRYRSFAVMGVMGLALILACNGAWAQASHPFGAPERSAGFAGPDALRAFFGQVSYWQSHFYRQLTGALRVWQDDGGMGGLLIGLSFAYGVFHALGPGHGKAVIASYVVANRQTARNGALLALLASLLQALVAIAVVSVMALVLNLTAGAMNNATKWLETGAYAMVTLVGLVLVWRHLLRPLLRRPKVEPTPADHDHGHHHHQHDHDHDHHDHGHEHACCGHAHAPQAHDVAGPLSLRRIWAVLLAVGLRPCSGALIVLVFALAQDFYLAGIVSALAMGAGTGLTVAVLAVLSVWASAQATRLGALMSSRWAARVRWIVEGGAALLVLLLGVTLLGGSLAA